MVVLSEQCNGFNHTTLMHARKKALKREQRVASANLRFNAIEKDIFRENEREVLAALL